MLKNPQCYVIGSAWGALDTGSAAVYGEYLLMRTCDVLPQNITIPTDIPKLVAQVYDENMPISPPQEFLQEYENAKTKHNKRTHDRKTRAKGYQIKGDPTEEYDTILGWLNNSYSDREDKSEAAVRDGSDSIEVLLVQERDSQLHFLPWINDGAKLPYHTPPDKQAKAIAGCCVRLPAKLNYDLDATINSIETAMINAGIVSTWYQSYWLNGTLVLILDENLTAQIGGYVLRYSKDVGLTLE